MYVYFFYFCGKIGEFAEALVAGCRKFKTIQFFSVSSVIKGYRKFRIF